jgi:triosephosphate isomerase
VIVTAGSDDKCAACVALGADHAINYRSQDFVAEVKRLTGGRGVDVVLDMVAGDYLAREVECLAEDGRLAIIAVQGGTSSEIDAGAVLRKRLSITGSTLRPRSVAYKTAWRRRCASQVWPLIETGRVKPVIHRCSRPPRPPKPTADGIEHSTSARSFSPGEEQTQLRTCVANWWSATGRCTAAAGQRRTAGRHLAARPYGATWRCACRSPYLSETAATLAGSDIAGARRMCRRTSRAPTPARCRPAMLAEFGCRYAIVGHSERRAYHGESDALVADKAKAALAQRASRPSSAWARRWPSAKPARPRRGQAPALGGDPPLAHCAGEMVVAYEPVWAIGTGRTATPEQAQAVHAVLRAQLQAATGRGDSMKILYGGSVKADNAATLLAQPDIDGGLIGGASLKAADFIAICRAAN